MAQATNTTLGTVALSGDLAGSATSPELSPSGAKAGSYTNVSKIHIDSKGRVTWVGAANFTNDILPNIANASSTSEGICAIGPNINVSTGVISVNTGAVGTRGLIQLGTGLSINQSTGATDVAVPDATGSIKGKVQPGTGFSISSGVLSLTPISDATTSSKGLVQIGTNLSVTSGTVSLADATASTKGKVQIGTGLVDEGSGQVRIQYADSTNAGIVKVGANLSVDGNGALQNVAQDATTSTKGGVQIGSGLSVTAGVLSLNDPTRGYASSSQLGLVKPGTNFTVDGTGLLSYTYTNLATATNVTKGIFTIASNLNNNSGDVSVNIATGAVLGGVKVGSGFTYTSNTISLPYASGSISGPVKVDGVTLTVAGDGTLALPVPPDATTSLKGKVQVGSNLAITSGVLSVSAPNATNATLGLAQGDGNSTSIDASGILSVNTANIHMNNAVAIRTAALIESEAVGNNLDNYIYVNTDNKVFRYKCYYDANHYISVSQGTSTASLHPRGKELYVVITVGTNATPGNFTFSPSSILGTTLSTTAGTTTIIKYMVTKDFSTYGLGAYQPVWVMTGLTGI